MNSGEMGGNSAVDSKSIRLSRLSEEVARIAASLADLASDEKDIKDADTEARGEGATIDAQVLKNLIDARLLRYKYFRGDLFADPAWDMLLELLRAEVDQHRVTVSALTRASNVPATTALRWIKIMTESGLFCRIADTTDARRVFLELSPATSKAMRAYFEDLQTLRVFGSD